MPNMLHFRLVEVIVHMKNLYDKERNLVNVSNSILRHYKLETFHPSLTELDAILDESKNKKICLILLDGFGKYIQELHSSSCHFILSHNKRTITSVFPPTTTSATRQRYQPLHSNFILILLSLTEGKKKGSEAIVCNPSVTRTGQSNLSSQGQTKY